MIIKTTSLVTIQTMLLVTDRNGLNPSANYDTLFINTTNIKPDSAYEYSNNSFVANGTCSSNAVDTSSSTILTTVPCLMLLLLPKILLQHL